MNAETALPLTLTRNLGDRSYDKRKAAALEIEGLVRHHVSEKDSQRVAVVVQQLASEFITSTSVNQRKGGLIGLASTAIGLGGHVNDFLPIILPPIMKCLLDHDHRVRYYACESLFNVSKIARESIFLYFNELFESLVRLSSDVDVDVKNGAQLLDRLIKEIVMEAKTFDVAKFMPLLSAKLDILNPYVRQLLVTWITLLDSVPSINMIDWLPDLLAGLMNMLGDENREIRQQADQALEGFLAAVKKVPAEEVEQRLKLEPILKVLSLQSGSAHKFNRLTAINWIGGFIELARDKLAGYFPLILGSVLQCISDAETEIGNDAQRTNMLLLELVRDTTAPFDLPPLLEKILLHLKSKHEPCRVASLTWIGMLFEKCSSRMIEQLHLLFPALCSQLEDPSDDVVILNLQAMAHISVHDEHFDSVIQAIMSMLRAKRSLLDGRCSMIVRKLSTMLDAKKIYMSFSLLLSEETDLEFAELMVQTLNLILLTAPELLSLRRLLSADSVTKEDSIFMSLFRSWSHSPIATFSLCLLSEKYVLATELIRRLGDIRITVGVLLQIDKLIELLESPVFVALRLQLLDASRPDHCYLLKALYGLLMILPQSDAFRTLNTRLNCVATLASALEGTAATVAPSKPAPEHSALLDHFADMQTKHADAICEAVAASTLHARSGQPTLSNPLS